VGRTLAASGNLAGGEALAGYRLERLDFTHHPCLGLDRDPPYSAVGGEQSVSRKELDELKQQIPLLDTWKHTIGGRCGDSAAAAGWGCARCTPITSPAS
jgi:hypothetical protein